MKRLTVVFVICLILLTSCVDYYSLKHLSKNPNTKWVSQDPNIYFEIYQSKKVSYSQITVDGVTTELICSFDYGAGIYFYPTSAVYYRDDGMGITKGNEILFTGSCTFNKDKLIVKITRNYEFLDDSIREITFIREDNPNGIIGRRPIDYPNTKWISQDPDIYLEIDESGNVSYTQITVDDVTTELICAFDYEAFVYFYPVSAGYYGDNGIEIVKANELLFTGKCICNKDKLIVKINNNKKGFLDDSIKEIIFIRE